MSGKDYVILGLVIWILIQFGLLQDRRAAIGNNEFSISNLEEKYFEKIEENKKLELERKEISAGVEALLEQRNKIIRSYDSVIQTISKKQYKADFSTNMDSDSLVEFFSKYRFDNHSSERTMDRDSGGPQKR